VGSGKFLWGLGGDGADVHYRVALYGRMIVVASQL